METFKNPLFISKIDVDNMLKTEDRLSTQFTGKVDKKNN